MKLNYKNWVPKGLVISVVAGSILLAILFGLSLGTDLFAGAAQRVFQILFGILTVVMVLYSVFCISCYVSFSYNGKRRVAARVIDQGSDYVVLPEGGKGLDVGCGGAALTIAVAKKNPRASMVGLDCWGKEYASFNRPLCENNAKVEGVAEQVSFVKGDACKLDFPDESFDAVTSNYCYHNIPSKDRQKIILESLRVVKKGGTFAIHDLFTKSKYGDMDILLRTLKDQGYEKVELLDTTDGLFLSKKEAAMLCLSGPSCWSEENKERVIGYAV